MIKLSRVKQELIYALSMKENILCRELAKQYLIAGRYKRVYCYHVRKCGGTTINQAFLSLSGKQSTQELYDTLCKRPNYRLINGEKVYVGFNQKLIEEGDYYYAFSQIPQYDLELPSDTFTVVCLRDPIQRVFSHYKMIADLKTNNIKHPVMPEEGRWLGKNFSDFLERMPKEHLLREVCMFSKSFDPDEAFENISRCSYYYFVENLSSAMKELSSRLELPLPAMHARKSSLNLQMNEGELDKACRKLKPSFDLIDKLKKYAPVAFPSIS